MKKSNLTTIAFALLTRSRIDVIGQLFGSEIIALLFFPYFKINNFFREYPIFYKIAVGYIFLIISLICSDILINETPFENYIRGWANLFFSFFTIIFLTYILRKNNKNIYIYLIFSAVSFFLFTNQLEGNTPFFEEGRTNVFKQHYMVGVNYLILLLAAVGFGVNKKIPLLLFFVYAILCFFLDSRSNGAIFFISSLVLIVKIFDVKLTKIRVLAMSIFFVIILAFSYIYYINKILDGTLTGDNTQQIKKLENPYNPIGLLQVGRTEVFVSLSAISEKMLWGYGSWAEDKTGKYAKLGAALMDSKTLDDSGRIPVHSIVLTVWLWAGFAGFISVCFIYKIILKPFFFVFKRSASSLLIITIPLTFELIWNFLFSPIGHLRETVPFVFALIIIQYYKMKKNESRI